MDDTSNSKQPPLTFDSVQRVRVIAGRTLDEWAEVARRDDCLNRMVPSDLRRLIAAIPKRP